MSSAPQQLRLDGRHHQSRVRDQDGASPEGIDLISSAGHAAEQTSFHLHLHLVPRWRRDGFGRIWPTEQQFQDADLEAVAGSHPLGFQVDLVVPAADSQPRRAREVH
jgi:hypothetical protein